MSELGELDLDIGIDIDGFNLDTPENNTEAYNISHQLQFKTDFERRLNNPNLSDKELKTMRSSLEEISTVDQFEHSGTDSTQRTFFNEKRRIICDLIQHVERKIAGKEVVKAATAQPKGATGASSEQKKEKERARKRARKRL